jgi:hypothetical protein
VATATGTGLLVTAASDDEYRGVVHQVRRVHLDLSTGELTEQEAGTGVATYLDAAGREAAASTARTDLEEP